MLVSAVYSIYDWLTIVSVICCVTLQSHSIMKTVTNTEVGILGLVTDSINDAGNAIGFVHLSVCFHSNL